MGEVDEIGREAGVAVADGMRQFAADGLEPVGHRPLLLLRRLETGERGNGNLRGLVVGRARERRVHDDQIDRLVRHLHVRHLRVALGAARPALPGGEQRLHLPGAGQVERADCGPAVAILPAAGPVGHRVDAGVAENHVGMDARQLGRAEMGGRRHDVGRDDGALHHRAVDRRVVAAGPAEAPQYGAVGGGEERARSAGQIGDAEVGIGVEVAPVETQPGDRQLGQKRGAGRQRVERREELPIDDHVLEHPAGQVVPRGHAYARKALRRLAEREEDAPGRVGAHIGQQVGRDLEDRPVVDVPQDQVPSVENAELEGCPLGPNTRDRWDVVASGDGGMEGERVGDDGQSHPVGLLAGALVENAAHVALDVAEAARHDVPDGVGGGPDAALKD